MSSTNDNTKTADDLLPAVSNNVVRMSAGAIDEQYIYEYIENPRSKIEALRRAQKNTGIDCHVSRSRAHDIHKRLQHRIDAALNDMALEGATLGYTILIDLALNSDQDAVRAGCASKLVEYAGKNKPATDKAPQSRDNIKDQIEATKARIVSITGKQL